MKTLLAFMKIGKRTAKDFVATVYEGPLKAMISEINDLILMEDGAPIHRSNAPKEWWELHGLIKLDWPAQSPDLNPIENVWMAMKTFVQKYDTLVRNEDTMKKASRDFWEGFEMEKINKLIKVRPRDLPL